MFARVLWYWAQLSRNQWLPKDELETLQLKKLHVLLKHAYEHVPFYKRLYDGHNLHPSQLKTLDDIRKFPILSKEFVRDIAFEERIADNFDVKRCTVKTTSGSTGIPLRVLEDPRSVDYLDAYHLRRLFEYGYRPWETIVRLTTEPPGKEVIGATGEARGGVMKSLRQSKVKRLLIAEGIDKHLQVLSTCQPRFMVAPPSYLKVLGKQQTPIRPRVLMTWGEILDDSTRASLSARFGSQVYDGYGCTEVAPIGGLAWECRRRAGLHINSDTVVLEVLKDGEPVAQGEKGEVVVTSLFRYATPMIRYRLGDVVTTISEPCPCGRGMPLIKNIDGRLVDFLRLQDGRLISPYAMMFAIQDIPGIARFRITQETVERIVVALEQSSEFSPKTISGIKGACSALLGNEISVDVQIIDEFPKEKGKFRAVASQLS